MESEHEPEPAPKEAPGNSPSGKAALGASPVNSPFPNLPFQPARRYYRTEDEVEVAPATTRYPARIVVPTILLAGLLAHGLCLRSIFYREDWTQVIANDWVDHGQWWQSNLRALTYLSHWLTYLLFGPSSVAFHAGNLALHLLNSLLVAGFARGFLTESADQSSERARRVGWFAGLLFAVHPLCSEVLNYTRWRDLELVSLFTLLAARSVLRWRRQRKAGFRWAAATLLAVAAATLCKEVGFILAAGTALLVWFGTPRVPESQVRRAVALPLPGPVTRAKTKLVVTPKAASMVVGNWPVALSLALVAACIALLAWPAWQAAVAALHHPRLGWHTLTKARVFWMSAQRFVFPVGLCSDHQVAWTVGVGDTVAWFAAAGEAVIIVLVGLLCFRRNLATRAVGILLAVALLDIVHRLANPNGDLMVEARLYPAMGFLCILLAWGLDRLLRWRRGGRETRRPLVTAYVMSALVLAGIVLSARRAETWHTRETLVSDILSQYPLQARALQEIQNADVRAEYWSETLKIQPPIRSALERALAFNTHSAHRKFFPGPLIITHINSEGKFALALLHLGQKREAFSHLEWVKKSVPSYGELAVSSQAEFLLVRGLVNEAAHDENAAVEDLKGSERLMGSSEAARELRRIWMSHGKPVEEPPITW